MSWAKEPAVDHKAPSLVEEKTCEMKKLLSTRRGIVVPIHVCRAHSSPPENGCDFYHSSYLHNKEGIKGSNQATFECLNFVKPLPEDTDDTHEAGVSRGP